MQYNTDGNVGAVKSLVVIHGFLLNLDNKFEAQRIDGEAIKELVGNANKMAKTSVSISEELKVCHYISLYTDGLSKSA